MSTHYNRWKRTFSEHHYEISGHQQIRNPKSFQRKKQHQVTCKGLEVTLVSGFQQQHQKLGDNKAIPSHFLMERTFKPRIVNPPNYLHVRIEYYFQKGKDSKHLFPSTHFLESYLRMCSSKMRESNNKEEGMEPRKQRL